MAIASATPLPAVAVSGDLYVNHRFGIAFRRPTGWRYEHVRTFADIRNEYEYATPDPALAEELRTGQLPVVVVSQDSVLRALAASATVYAEENPLQPGETLVEVAPLLVQGFSSFLKDFRLLAEPRASVVASRPAIEFLFTFHYEDRLGNRGPVRHRTLAVLNSSLLFTFNMLDIPADGVNAQGDFDAIRNSIVLS